MPPEAPAVVSVFDVEPRFIGGTETYARELSVQLRNHGWRSVLCFAGAPSEEVRRFLESPNVSLDLVDFVQGSERRVLSQMAQVFRRHRPTISHFHYTKFLSFYPWLARLCGVKRVLFTDHASRPANHVSRRASLARRWVARAINLPLSQVISVSNYGHRSFTERGLFPKANCQMIYNGVDLSRVSESMRRAAEFRRRFSIPAERQIVLQVSWIIPEKGVLDLLAAARIVAEQEIKAHFVFVGDGPSRVEYTRRAADLGLGDRITWTGLVEDPFSAGVYDAAEIVCQVSRWEEVFGWVIAEAMAYRKPVIATRVGGIPEVVADEDSGFLIERGDVETLAKRLLRLLRDPGRRQAMGKAGRMIVERKFDLRKNVTQMLEAYDIANL
jgi:glycosyltransferase involved in cell wall biosynthesis